jgi:hypothetical protein
MNDDTRAKYEDDKYKLDLLRCTECTECGNTLCCDCAGWSIDNPFSYFYSFHCSECYGVDSVVISSKYEECMWIDMPELAEGIWYYRTTNNTKSLHRLIREYLTYRHQPSDGLTPRQLMVRFKQEFMRHLISSDFEGVTRKDISDMTKLINGNKLLNGEKDHWSNAQPMW